VVLWCLAVRLANHRTTVSTLLLCWYGHVKRLTHGRTLCVSLCVCMCVSIQVCCVVLWCLAVRLAIHRTTVSTVLLRWYGHVMRLRTLCVSLCVYVCVYTSVLCCVVLFVWLSIEQQSQLCCCAGRGTSRDWHMEELSVCLCVSLSLCMSVCLWQDFMFFEQHQNNSNR